MIAYTYNNRGIFQYAAEDYGFLPNNATRVPPEDRPGHVARWTGDTWEYLEDHRGKSGWVGGAQMTIRDPGPLPEGWSDTPPDPSPGEAAASRRMGILARLGEIDAASVRPLRTIARGEGTDDDRERLAALDSEAADLRRELVTLREDA